MTDGFAGAVPFPITAGSIALTSSHHATISGLQLGGGPRGEAINRYVLSQSGPLGVDASVNGDLSVSTAQAVPEMIGDRLKTPAPIPTRTNPLKGLKNLFKK